jgi:tellurite resistance protein
MSHEFLDDRRRALEEQFFAKHEHRLKERLRQEQERAARLEGLRESSGIESSEVLEDLTNAGLSAETVAALALVPLVEVAWADGEIHAKEREAVLRAASDVGIRAGSSAAELLESWLTHRPDSQLLVAWKEYVERLGEELTPGARETLRDDVLGRARRVAEAAGGFLGAAAISGKEKDKLYELERAFV